MESRNDLIRRLKKLKIKPIVKPQKQKEPQKEQQNKQYKEQKIICNDYDEDDIFIIKSTKEYYTPDPIEELPKKSAEEIRKEDIKNRIYQQVYEETKRKLAEEKMREEEAKRMGIYREPSRRDLMQQSENVKYSAHIIPAADRLRDARHHTAQPELNRGVNDFFR